MRGSNEIQFDEQKINLSIKINIDIMYINLPRWRDPIFRLIL